MTSPASCVCEPQRIVGGCAICNGASVVSDAEYCRQWMDDAPGIRADCARHLKAGRACVDCEHRDIRSEVKELRRQLRALAQTQRLGPMEG